jgi:DNA mismatch repair ATPase MutS
LLADFVLAMLIRKQVAAVGAPAHDLRIIGLLIARLEQERFEAPLLRESMARLQVSGMPASQRIRRLERWIEWLDASDHLLVRIIRPALLWREQIAMGIEAWRRESGPHIGDWIRALGEFEALSSIAALAFERPEWTFPELLDARPALFEAQALRHPLMPRAKCVPNDVALNNDPRLLIVSGSNMSGKSTLLRSVGLNGVLARAGAPVAARQLRISEVLIGASIRTTDSLQDNRSRFMAEILRIRQIVDLTKRRRSTLFLLDELLSGTNSHDRRLGASGIVSGLLAGDTIGLLTTHDLALTQIADEANGAAMNVHFEDSIEDGELEFDYLLRPGIVTHSNALALMRAVGLEV